MANDHGIPWQGKIPSDVAYFRDKTLHGNVMMGYGWYVEQKQPLPERRNIVATTKDEPMRSGFETAHDAREFLKNFEEDIWVGGGAALFASILDLADELYITQLQGDWHCTKFFPDFKQYFELATEGEPTTENNVTFSFQIWKRKAKL